jgi:hypothetical protein
MSIHFSKALQYQILHNPFSGYLVITREKVDGIVYIMGVQPVARQVVSYGPAATFVICVYIPYYKNYTTIKALMYTTYFYFSTSSPRTSPQ